MRRNTLRELLNDDKPTVGTRIMSSWPTIVELIGHSGVYDYVEFSAEYAPYDLHELDNLGRAIELHDHLTGMIKIEQAQRGHQAMRAIGSGIQNVLFADPRTVEEVEECVRAVRAERPGSNGRHGVGMRRDVGIVLEAGTEAFANALDDAVVAIMIEKKSAIEDLENILSVPGLDMVQFGPADYAMSLGLTGQFLHPQVKEAEKYLIETAQKKGIAVRAELRDADGFEPYLEMGVKHFNVGIEVAVLYDWYRKSGAILRRELGLKPAAEPGDARKSAYSR